VCVCACAVSVLWHNLYAYLLISHTLFRSTEGRTARYITQTLGLIKS